MAYIQGGAVIAWLYIAYVYLILGIMLFLVNKPWVADWQFTVLIVIGGPALWLIYFFWWLRSKLD